MAFIYYVTTCNYDLTFTDTDTIQYTFSLLVFQTQIKPYNKTLKTLSVFKIEKLRP